MPKRIVGHVEGVRPGDAAQFLGVSRQRVHQLMNDGRLDVIETALGYLITPESLRKLKDDLTWYHEAHVTGFWSTSRYLPVKPIPAKYKPKP